MKVQDLVAQLQQAERERDEAREALREIATLRPDDPQELEAIARTALSQKDRGE